MIIIGKNGQLASSFARILSEEGKLQPVILGRPELDLLNPESIHDSLDRAGSFVRQLENKVIINAAAFTNVDLAETEQEEALKVNAIAPKVIASWAKKNGYILIHFSTDFVYSGEGDLPWNESDPALPINFYGKSKLQGEQYVTEACPEHLIFRVSWLYGGRQNFPRAILKQSTEKESLRVVADQFGAPSFTDEIAICSLEAIRAVLSNKNRDLWGTYNLANEGVTTKYGFAVFAIEKYFELGLITRKPHCEAISSESIQVLARRPKNCRLSLRKFRETFGISPTPWEYSFSTWARSLKI